MIMEGITQKSSILNSKEIQYRQYVIKINIKKTDADRAKVKAS